MKIRLSFFLFIVLLLQSCASFGQYRVPQDQNVLKTFNQEKPEFLDPHKFSVLVWNIFKADKKDFYKEFARFSADKDILVLQEAYLDQRFERFLEKDLHFHGTFATSWIRKNIASGVMNLLSVRVDKSFWHRSQYLEPVLKTPKMLLYQLLPFHLSQEKLLLINIHAINFVGTYKFSKMLEQALKVIDQHSGPILFAGDFNTWSKGKYSFMKSELERRGLSPVNFEEDHRVTRFGLCLDHSWVRGLRVLEARAPKTKGSDHNPMIFDLSLF